MTTTPFRRTAVALALVGALGLGAVAADRVLPSTNAAASGTPATTIAAPANPAARSLPGFADLVAQHGKAVVRVSAVKEAPRTGRPGGQQFDPDRLPPFFPRPADARHARTRPAAWPRVGVHRQQ